MTQKKTAILKAEANMSQLDTDVLQAMLFKEFDLIDIVKAELASRGYNAKGKFVGQKTSKSYQKEWV